MTQLEPTVGPEHGQSGFADLLDAPEVTDWLAGRGSPHTRLAYRRHLAVWLA